ncbi:MAG TPA: M57 family metalloprotease [Longimicrobium sp.]|nr:M57 family metalloprotease [Longimicrobium sp.]
MMPPRRSRAAVAASLLLAAALAACSDAPTTSRAEDLTAQIVALGFRADMVEDFGQYVLVEGDIYLSKAELRGVPVVTSDDPRRPSFQYRTSALVGSPKVNDIRVDVSGLSSQTAWQTAARDAMAHWSSISNSYVRLVESGPADITVATTCTSPNVAAYASFPSGWNPGSTIFVNTCFAYSTTQAQKVHNMVHEFGHTLGFRHSNYTQMGESAGTEGAVHVPGSPTSGNAAGSVMNGGTALNSWAGFGSHDQSATAYLYPLPSPTPWVATSGTTPEIQWWGLDGATGYTVSLVREAEVRNQYYQVISYTIETYPVGTTTQTSILDAARTYTGATSCEFDGTTYSFRYEVRADFATGYTGGWVAAPVADCSRMGEMDQ